MTTELSRAIMNLERSLRLLEAIRFESGLREYESTKLTSKVHDHSTYVLGFSEKLFMEVNRRR